MMGIMAAKKKTVETKSLAEIGMDSASVGPASAKTRILRLFIPEEKRLGKILEGESVAEKAALLAKIIRAR
jgi:electron transfer flavoprotein beta subunit